MSNGGRVCVVVIGVIVALVIMTVVLLATSLKKLASDEGMYVYCNR